jgi:glutamate/tyrosine decarboxylase-like PLP-dependent enzyme
MDKNLQNDLANLTEILEKVRQQGTDYLENIDKRPTSTQSEAPPIEKLSENGIGTLGALDDFNARFEPILVASSGPRYWGFVTGGTTPAAIAGDWLTSIYDQNTQAIKGQSDISANIELETIRLLLDLFELPNDFFGGFVTGATISNFTGLAVARQWLGKQLGKDFAKEGVSQNLKVLTATPHSSAVKALALLGMGSNNIIKIKVLEGNREAVDLNDFEAKIAALNGEPFIFIGSGGTVNTVDFDDFEGIIKLKSKYNFWCHIDAAFGGFAACSPAHKHLLKGWESADSITIDCHKWLNVPYDSAIFLVKEKHSLLQIETFQNSSAPYLGDPMANFSYLNFLPENSRRLRALPTWFSLMAYGKTGIRSIVEKNIEVARLFGAFIEQHQNFELLAPVRLNTVCFTLSGTENQENVSDFLKKLNETGKVFMTPTVYAGQKGIRAAFVNWRTTEQDIELVISEMLQLVR